ncbi:MAG: peptide-binding protein [Endomicrobia bacterium]|nr:peptide-binding protein [Endomicrobiia bacterium]MCL2799333.1 peptide-binding protein [Endomicrobiia bacterium]
MKSEKLDIKKIVLLFCFLFFFSCSSEKTDQQDVTSDNSSPVYGDAFIIASLSDASYLNPVLASDTSSSLVLGQIFNGLVKYDKDLNLTGDLAESFEVSKDGLEIIFKLRKNVKWHDGVPFTAQDVKFTYETLIDPNVKTPYSSNFTIIKDFKIIDDYTVKVIYDKPFAPNLERWGMSIIPKHIFEGHDINTAAANRNPVGTGPYKFKSWQTDQKIILEANPDYFEGKPYISRYIVQIVPDQAVQFLELRKQSLDAVTLTPDQWYAYDSFFKFYNKFREPAFAFTYLGFNMQRKPFDDKKFILAMQLAINKKDIIEGVLLNTGKEAIGPYPPQSWAYNADIPESEYNPQKAAEMLKELGFEDINNDGWLEYKGKQFEFTITTNQGNKQRELTAQIVQEQLKKIGIKTNVRIIEFSTFINQYIAKREFDAVIMGWSLTLDPDQYSLWHSKQTAPREYNFLSYNNPEVDGLYEKARSIFDIETRKKIYYRIQEIMEKDPPCIFLYYPDSMQAVHKRFKGINPAPIGIYHNFIEWWVPKSQQRYFFSDR